MPAITERTDKHDREIAAIRKLLLTGMKLLVNVQQAQKRTELSIQRLEQAQQKTEISLQRLEQAQTKTDQTLERFIRSLERGNGNGHRKGRRIE